MATQELYLAQQQQSTIKILSSAIAQKRIGKRNLRTHHNHVATQLAMQGNKKKKAGHIPVVQNGVNQNPGEESSLRKQEDDIQSLDISDMLKTVCHQKKALNPRRRQELYHIHHHCHLAQDDYKYFMLIASQANYRKLEYPGYYANLLLEATNYPDLFFTCINKDIPRTMPDDHPLQVSLKNVLYAYAIRNPALLYCQGMNYLVGFLLINKFSEEETFWFLVQLIEDIVMPDYFKDLSTISLTVQIFENVVEQVFPQLAAEMHDVGMESGIFLVAWYICLFTKGFINSVSQFLLQYIVLQSYDYPIGYTLMRISLGIFAALFTREQPFCFQEKDFKSLKQSIQGSVYELSLDELKSGLSYFQFNFQSYQKLMKIYIKKKQSLFALAIEKQLQEKKLSLPPCNVDKPVCIHRVEIEKKIGTVEEVLILKNDIPIKDQYMQNYFPSKISRGQPKISYESAKECPITHHSHICHLSNTSKLIPHAKLKLQSSEYLPVFEGDSSIEIESRFSKIEDRFSEFSAYFIVDENEQVPNHEDELMELSIDDKLQLDPKQSHSPGTKSNTNFVASVGNVFRKAFGQIKLLRIGLAKGTNTYFNSKASENSP